MKINKHLFLFSGLFALLTGSYFVVLVKFFPILVHHTFYYCREMARMIALNLPGNIGIIIFGLVSVSLVIAIFRLLTTVARVFKFRQMLLKSSVKHHNLGKILKSLELNDKVVVLNEDKPFAYCFGIRHPKIFLTTGLLTTMDEREIRVILRHEKYHLEHRDNLVLLVALFIESLFPFFPIFTDFIRLYKTDRELLADRFATQNDLEKQSLKSILKKLLQYEPSIMPALAPAIADIDTLETRIKSLLSIKLDHHKFRRRNLILSIASASLLISLMWTPINAFELHENGTDAMVVCNENVSCESVCKVKNTGNFQSTSPVNFSSHNFSVNH